MTLSWLAAAFLVCLIAIGLPFWLTPYSQINLPDILILPGLIVVVPLAAALRFFSVARSLTIVGVLTGAMLLANIARIVVDTAADPTSHNLLPFELAITLVVGSALSAAGCVAGISIVALLRLAGWYNRGS